MIAPAASTAAATATKQIESLLLERRELEKKHERAIAAQDQRFLKLEADYNAVFSRLKARDAEVGLLTDNAERLEGDAREAKDAASRLEMLLEEAQRQASASQHAADESEAAALEAQRKVDGAQRELAGTRARLDAAEGRERAVREEYEQHRARAASLLSERESQLEVLRVAAAGAGGHAGHSMAAAEEKARQLEAANDELSGERLRLTTKLNEAEATAQRLQALATKLQAEAKELATAKEEAQRSASVAKHNLLESQDLYEGERAAHMQTKVGLEAIVQEKAAALRQAEKDLALLQKRKLAAADTHDGERLGASNAAAAAAAATAGASSSSGNGAGSAAAAALSSVDWERRSKELAELILEKQSALEAKRSECEQWKTRYEVSQQRLREVEMVSSSVQALQGITARSGGGSSGGMSSRAVDILSGDGDSRDDGDFNRSRFFGNLQRRGPWGEKVVSVARKLDTFSLRSGSYLRRSSVLRVAVLIYVVVLQLWVFFVVSISSNVPQSAATAGLQEVK